MTKSYRRFFNLTFLLHVHHTLLRKYVDTTVEIDYDKMLAPAGLRLNKSTWKLETIPSMSSLQEKINTDMFGK